MKNLQTLKDMKKWKNNNLHIKAKKMGPVWYKTYKVQISELKNDYDLDQL